MLVSIYYCTTVNLHVNNHLNSFSDIFSVFLKPKDGIGQIQTDNFANKTLNYYYFIPEIVLKNPSQHHPILVLVPGLSGRGEDFAARPPIKDFAEKEGFIIIAPTFIWDTANYVNGTSYQFPGAWSGNALIKIINDFVVKNNILFDKLYLFGFSAGAQFSGRFALLDPEIVKACAFHASGGRIIPEYHNDVKFFVGVGSNDEQGRQDNAKNFYNAAISLKIPTIYKKYDNVPHALSDQQVLDSLEFFKKVKDGKL